MMKHLLFAQRVFGRANNQDDHIQVSVFPEKSVQFFPGKMITRKDD